MDLSKKNIVIDKSKRLSSSSIERVADAPIEYIEPINSENTDENSLLKESEGTSKKNKIIVISIFSGIALAISIVAYLAFRKKG